jgi:ATP-dependent DNA ligase
MRRCLGFPGVTTALTSLDGDFILDGELIAFDPKGRPSFQILQNNLSHALPVYFYCFDLLNRDGETLVSVWIERGRDLLHSMFAAPEDPVRLSPLLEASSGQVLEAVRKLGLEGVVGNGSVPSTIGWLDQAPREPGVHRWRIYPGHPRLRCVARRRLSSSCSRRR